MKTARRVIIATSLIVAACGDDGGNKQPDAAVEPPVATSLAFGTAPPASVEVRTAFGFTVEVHDQNGALLATDSTTQITIGGSTGSVYGARAFSGTLTETVSGGVATFAGLAWPLAETVTFDVSSTGLPDISDTSITIAEVAYAHVVVADQTSNAVSVFARDATGAATAVRTITGSTNTTFSYSWGIGYDEVADQIVVANYGAPAVNRFAANADGDVAPISTLTNEHILGPSRIFFDYLHDEMYFGDEDENAVLVYGRTASGDMAPVREITGTSTAVFGSMDGAAVRYDTDELYAIGFGQPAIYVFDRTATGTPVAKRTITGATNTKLDAPFEVMIDSLHHEIIVIDENAGVLVYPIDADGDVAPTRHITPGGMTNLSSCQGGAYDAAAGEIFVACSNGIFVFDRTADGDVMPKRSFTSTTTPSCDDIALMR